MGNFVSRRLEPLSVVLYLPAPADSVGVVIHLDILQLLLKIEKLLRPVLVTVSLNYKPRRAPFQLTDLLPCGRQLDFKGADLGSLGPRPVTGTFLEFLKLCNEVGFSFGVFHEIFLVEVPKVRSLRDGL